MAMDDANVKVFCRVRPPNDRESGVRPSALSGSAGFLARSSAAASSVSLAKKCVSVSSSDGQALFLHSKHGPARTFTFDRVFGEDASQNEVFNVVGAPITQACLEGYNGTIFAYGQTGSGKTFTMQGPDDVIDSDTHRLNQEQLGLRGLVPRVFDYLFDNVVAQDSRKNVQHTFRCSFLEIYNERVYDLLDGGSANDAAGLQLRENGRKGVHVEGLIESVVTNSKKAAELMTVGAQNRRVGQTSMNRESSRSHSVFILQMQSKEVSAEGTKIRTSSFNLVDLAGSERQRSTDAAGERLKEAGSINKSLSALGNVIMGLSEQSVGKHRHVHYRDSKLTFLLKDSLGGNSKTFMVATISPAEDSAFETLSTLKFAQRAKMIQNSAVVNEDSVGNSRFLQKEIQSLRLQLQQAHQEIARNIPGSGLLLQGEVSSSQDSIAPSTQQLGPQCDPAVDTRFRELEESFATTAEKYNKLFRSCEYLQLQNGNFQALCAELKNHIAHLKMILRLKGFTSSGAHEYKPTADAIEWRIKYEEMEERFVELQDELERSGIGITGETNNEMENLNTMLLTLTKQLAFVLHDKHDLQDRLLEKQLGKDESMDGPSSQEIIDADFSARLEEALKLQAGEYQAKLDSVAAVKACTDEKAAEMSLELVQIKEREASWSLQLHDIERQLADCKVALQCSEESHSSTREKLVQEKVNVENLETQLRRAREASRLEFEATLADATTANRDLENSNKLLNHQLAAMTTNLKQREHQVQEAENSFAQVKVEMAHLEEMAEQTASQLGEARDELKEATLQAAHMETQISDRDIIINDLKHVKAALTEEKLSLEQKLAEAKNAIMQLNEDADATSQKHADAINSLKCQSQKEERRLIEGFEKQLHVKEGQIDELRAEFDDYKVKTEESDRYLNTMLEEKETSLAALQRLFENQSQESKLAIEDLQRKLFESADDLSQLSQLKDQLESERVSALQEVKRLQGEMKTLQDAKARECARLLERIELLSAKTSDLETQKAGLQKNCEELQVQLSKLEDIVKQSSQDNQEYQLAIEDLQRKLFKSADDLSHLSKEKDQIESERASALQDVERLQGDMAMLEDAKARECARLSERVELLSAQTSDLETRKTELQKNCEGLQVQFSQLEDSIEKSNQEVEVLQQQTTAQTKELAELRTDLASAQEYVRQGATTHSQQLEDLATRDAKIEEMKQQLAMIMDEMSNKLEKAAREIRDAEDTASHQREEIRMYKGIQSTLRDEMRKLEFDRLELSESLKTEQESKQDVEVKFAAARELWVDEKNKIKQQSQESISALEMQREEAVAKVTAQMMEKIKQLESVVEEKDKRLQLLSKSLAEAEERLAGYAEDDSAGKVKQLQAVMEELDVQHKLVVAKNVSLKEKAVSELKEHKVVVNRLQKELAAAEEQVQCARKDLEEQKAAALAHETAQKEAKAKAVAQDTVGQLKRKFLTDKVKMQREIQTLTKKLDTVTKENEKLVGHHNSRQKIQHHVKVKEENNRLLDQVRQLTDEKAKLLRSLDKLRSTLKEKENIGVDSISNKPPLVSPASSASSKTQVTKKLKRPSLGSASSATAGAAASQAMTSARLAARGRPTSRSHSPGPTKKRVRTQSSSSGPGWQR